MTKALTMEQVRLKAPSAFAQHAYEGVSDKYKFISTERVINMMAAKGWFVVDAKENFVRIDGKKGFQKHGLKFESELSDLIIGSGSARIQAVMTNAHDRTAAFVFHAGAFVNACANGMVVAESTFGRISIKHIGFEDYMIEEAQEKIIGAAPAITSEIKTWQSIDLSNDRQLDFAKHSLNLKYEEGKAPVEAISLLKAHRYEDNGSDLWSVTNRIQENVIRAGARYIAESGRRQTTRAVKSITEDMRLNKGIWSIASEIAKSV